MSPESQPRIPGLEIIDLIGEGGQASVYRAHQPSHDRVVAVRVIRAPWINDDVLRRFDRERQALGRISDHPGIVSLLESGRAGDGCPYLVIEYCPGGSLADLLTGGPLPSDDAISIALLLADALATAHRADVLHRDVKPENVLCSSYEHWQLGDFGVAGLLNVGDGLSTTVRVSFAHAAPESFDEGEPTPACDVYSLASTLFTMVTATEPMGPVDGESRASSIRRVISDPRPDPRIHGIDEPLARVLEAGLALDPNDRPASADDFAARLRMIGTGSEPEPSRRRINVMSESDAAPDPETDGRADDDARHTVTDPGPPPPPGSEFATADNGPGRGRGGRRAGRWRLKVAAAALTFAALFAGGGALAAADVIDFDGADLPGGGLLDSEFLNGGGAGAGDGPGGGDGPGDGRRGPRN